MTPTRGAKTTAASSSISSRSDGYRAGTEFRSVPTFGGEGHDIAIAASTERLFALTSRTAAGSPSCELPRIANAKDPNPEGKRRVHAGLEGVHEEPSHNRRFRPSRDLPEQSSAAAFRSAARARSEVARRSLTTPTVPQSRILSAGVPSAIPGPRTPVDSSRSASRRSEGLVAGHREPIFPAGADQHPRTGRGTFHPDLGLPCACFNMFQLCFAVGRQRAPRDLTPSIARRSPSPPRGSTAHANSGSRWLPPQGDDRRRCSPGRSDTRGAGP